MRNAPESFEYQVWRHGGWYVMNIRYPSGACGCVSRNYEDGKWRIACDPRGFDKGPTFKSRDAAARAEWELVQTAFRELDIEAAVLKEQERVPGRADAWCAWLRKAHSEAIAA